MDKLLLSTAYLPNIQYMRAIAQSNEAYIEQYESFPKQSYRNRCEILLSSGVAILSIPIVKGNSKHLLKDTKISYGENWQSHHWHSIVSAYGSSPFFEYFRDDFEPFYRKKYNYLLDFNNTILSMLLHLLEIKTKTKLTKDFIREGDHNYKDLRNFIHPKKQQKQNENYYTTEPYGQVFGQYHRFKPNLSIIDTLFNIGFETREYIFKNQTVQTE